MNILFLIFSFNTGGIEKQLIEMSNNMTEKGHRIVLVVINHNYNEKLFDEINDNVKIIKFERPTASKNKLSYMIKLSRLCKEEKIDIIHCQEPTSVAFCGFVRLLFPKIRIVETVHSTFENSQYTKLQLILANIVADRVIAISNAVEKEIIKRHVNPQKMITINNAVNTRKFVFCESNEKDSFDENSVITIGNVARFCPEQKGQDILVKAIAIVKEKYPHVKCRFVGEVPKNQQRTLELIKQYIINNDLISNIEFCSYNNIPQFLSEIDIYVQPSRTEGFGIAVAEAMSVGLLCIASDTEGLAEVISDSSLGILFCSGNSVDLANKIFYAISNFGKYDRRKISGYISDKFGIDTMVDKHIELYQHLC